MEMVYLSQSGCNPPHGEPAFFFECASWGTRLCMSCASVVAEATPAKRRPGSATSAKAEEEPLMLDPENADFGDDYKVSNSRKQNQLQLRGDRACSAGN
jgi:hypothetical protein